MNKLTWDKKFIKKVGKLAFQQMKNKKIGAGATLELVLKIVESSSVSPAVKFIKDSYVNLTLDPDFSGRIFRVYFNEEKKVAYFIHSPTDISKFEDIIADVLLSLSIHSKRIKLAIRQHFKAEEKYLKLGYKITIIGYSLGGYIGGKIADKSKANDIILISQPLVPSNIKQKINDKTYRIRSVNDGVSLLYSIAEKGIHDINVKAESKNIVLEHKAALVLPRLPQDKFIGLDLVGGNGHLSNLEKIFKNKKRLKNNLKKSSSISNIIGMENCEEIEECQPENVGSGKKQNVSELKAEIKKLRYKHRVPVKQAPITKQRKTQLVETLSKLREM